MRRVSTAAFVVFLCGITYGQSSFQGLTPGVSKKNDVESILGKPLRSLSTTVYAYQPPDGIAGVEVEYDTNLSVVERIEISFLKPITRSALIQKFNLSQQPESTKTNSEGNLVEYYGSSLVVLTFASNDQTGGVSRIGYVSQSFFARATGKSGGTSRGGGPDASTATAGDAQSSSQGKMDLPDYMRPPNSTSVDRDGRASAGDRSPTDSAAAKNKRSSRGASKSSSTSDPEFTATTGSGDIRVAPPNRSRAATESAVTSATVAQRLVGAYQFAQTISGSRLGQVQFVNRNLRLKVGDEVYTLEPIAADDFTAGNQGQGNTVSFKASNKPGVKVYFLLVDEKVEKIFIVESQRQPKRFYFGVPK